jgi:hypothetical protein
MTYRRGETERLSLKKFLDTYMKRSTRSSELQLDELRARFLASVKLVHEVFGSTAFHNISPSDPDKLVAKFSPTLCDSLLIAADSALRTGYALPADPEAERRALLKNDEYRFAITKETMSRTCIDRRIGMACDRLFGVRCEE